MPRNKEAVMNMKPSVVVCALLGASLLFPPAGSCESPPKEKIVALVDKAAALLEHDGEKALAEFRKKDSVWFQGDTYIFVDDTAGKNLCHPARPDLEGKSLLDMRDASGKLFVREMVDLIKSKDSGWVEYMWHKPGETKVAKKSSYIKKAKFGGKTCFVGCGVYLE